MGHYDQGHSWGTIKQAQMKDLFVEDVEEKGIWQRIAHSHHKCVDTVGD